MADMDGDHEFEEFERLFDEAMMVENEEQRTSILEQAVREADRLGDVEAGFEARTALMEAAVFSGHGERALVAFSWCLAQCDKRSTVHSEVELLWPYKWIIESLLSFPQVSKARILEAWEDLSRRYDSFGLGRRAKWMLRTMIHARMEELAAAKEPFERWLGTPRDELSDCRLCDEHGVALHHDRFANRSEALKGYRRILRQRESCRRVPQATYGQVLRLLLEEGEQEEAIRAHQRGMHVLEYNKDCLDIAAKHLRFRVWAQDPQAAAQLAEQFWPHAEGCRELDNVFHFYVAMRALVRDVGERLGEDRLALRPPRSVSLSCADQERLEVAELAGWLDEKLAGLAAQFDARNGNDGFTRMIHEDVELDRLSRPLSLGRGKK